MGWRPTGGGGASPLTTKGDVYTYDTADARLPVGTNDQVLTADSTQSLGVKWAAGGSGSGRVPITGFGEDNLAASLTDSQLYRNVQGVETQIPVTMDSDGDIVGITVAASAARTAGTAIFEVFKNGLAIGLTVVLDATDTQYAYTTQAAGADAFVAGDRLDIRVTTDGSWAPTTADVEAVIVVQQGSDATAAVPEWLKYLAVRQSDETPHADDDFFTSDTSADYTEQTVSGSATWTTLRGLLSVRFDDQTAADMGAYLKTMTSVSAPVTIETSMRLFPNGTMGGGGTEFAMAGLVFADGTSTSSNQIGIEVGMDGDGPVQLLNIEGTLTNLDASFLSVVSDLFVNYKMFDRLYLRLVWIDTTTAALAVSIDGVTWTDLGAADDTIASFTPTHIGFWVSTYGGNDESYASFDYLRRYDSDLSI